MNNIDKDYLSLCKDILDNGVQKNTRNGKVISVFGRQIRHSMSSGFPLLTTKKMHWKSIVAELLWFLKGSTDIRDLWKDGCHIWDGDCYKHYVICTPTPPGTPERLSKEEFITTIKINDGFAKKWGDLGSIYGKQWRNWNGIDQIANLTSELKTNPDSRRLMVSAWNVGELDQMVLPPCHYGFQVYTRELSLEERLDIFTKSQVSKEYKGEIQEIIDMNNTPTRAISLMWNQRSVDVPLGLPFNIASYGLLLEMLAKQVNMIPDELIGNLGDCHIYENQIEGIKEQLTRESFELPKLTFPNYDLTQTLYLSPQNYQIENYQSHSAIKMPLSN